MNFKDRLKEILQEAKPVATFTNKKDGIESAVTKTSKGFSVTLKDIDAGEVLPTAKIFKDKKEAIAYAKLLVKG